MEATSFGQSAKLDPVGDAGDDEAGDCVPREGADAADDDREAVLTGDSDASDGPMDGDGGGAACRLGRVLGPG